MEPLINHLSRLKVAALALAEIMAGFRSYASGYQGLTRKHW
jgi:hypothetical protein